MLREQNVIEERQNMRMLVEKIWFLMSEMNAITLLLAYIAELEEEMTGALSQGNDVIELWTEIRTVTDLILHSSRCLAQSTGRTVVSGGGWAESTLAEFVHHGRKRQKTLP